MTALPLFQIDTFTGQVFQGNPAAVCPLEYWLDEAILQAIAQENNLAETAFFVPQGDGVFQLRWFTPRYEVDLCGHATLAAAFLIFTELEPTRQSVQFESPSGPLWVTRRDDGRLALDFPAQPWQACTQPPALLRQGLDQMPQAIYQVDRDPNYFAIYEDEDVVRRLQPDLGMLEKLHPYGVVVSAAGREFDCVSRYFAPSYGIPEDPVTGSIHCALVPYWAEVLGRRRVRAYQASTRGGELLCEDRAERVIIAGFAVKYLAGEIFI